VVRCSSDKPLTQRDIAIRFVLARPCLFINTASDIDLLAQILEPPVAGPARTDVEVDGLIRRRGDDALRLGAAERVRRHGDGAGARDDRDGACSPGPFIGRVRVG
jgi:hypothetical protein